MSLNQNSYGLHPSQVQAILALLRDQFSDQSTVTAMHAALSGTGPYGLLANGKTYCAKTERALTTTQGTVMLDTTSSPGSGIVSNIDMVVTGAAAKDGVLRFYIDGEVTPSFEVEMHNFGTFDMAWGKTYITTRLETESIEQTPGNSGYRVRFNYPIFYQRSIRITLSTPIAGDLMWTNVTYRTNVTLPLKLKSSQLGYANRRTNITHTQFGNRTVRFLERPAGTRGVIVAWSYSLFFPFGGGSVQEFNEYNPVVYNATDPLDGSGTPFAAWSGTEDFAHRQFYYTNGEAGNSLRMFMHAASDGSGSVNVIFVDLLDTFGGISYDNGVVFALERASDDPVLTPGLTCDAMHMVLYYEPYQL